MARPDKLTLIEGKAASSNWVPIDGGYYNWNAICATWNGATLTLQWSPNGGTTALDIDGCVLSANGGVTEIPIATGHVKATLTGSPSAVMFSAVGAVN
jgi:hypothetical protein